MQTSASEAFVEGASSGRQRQLQQQHNPDTFRSQDGEHCRLIEPNGKDAARRQRQLSTAATAQEAIYAISAAEYPEDSPTKPAPPSSFAAAAWPLRHLPAAVAAAARDHLLRLSHPRNRRRLSALAAAALLAVALAALLAFYALAPSYPVVDVVASRQLVQPNSQQHEPPMQPKPIETVADADPPVQQPPPPPQLPAADAAGPAGDAGDAESSEGGDDRHHHHYHYDQPGQDGGGDGGAGRDEGGGGGGAAGAGAGAGAGASSPSPPPPPPRVAIAVLTSAETATSRIPIALLTFLRGAEDAVVLVSATAGLKVGQVPVVAVGDDAETGADGGDGGSGGGAGVEEGSGGSGGGVGEGGGEGGGEGEGAEGKEGVDASSRGEAEMEGAAESGLQGGGDESGKGGEAEEQGTGGASAAERGDGGEEVVEAEAGEGQSGFAPAGEDEADGGDGQDGDGEAGGYRRLVRRNPQPAPPNESDEEFGNVAVDDEVAVAEDTDRDTSPSEEEVEGADGNEAFGDTADSLDRLGSPEDPPANERQEDSADDAAERQELQEHERFGGDEPRRERNEESGNVPDAMEEPEPPAAEEAPEDAQHPPARVPEGVQVQPAAGDDQSSPTTAQSNEPIPLTLRGIAALFAQFPSSPWYLLLTDATYPILENVLQLLSAFNPDESYYFGASADFSGCDGVRTFGEGPSFAYGSAGIVLSRGAVKAVLPRLDECEQKYSACTSGPTGDIQLGLCLRDVGVHLQEGLAFQPFPPSIISTNWPSDPCARPLTFGQMSTTQTQSMYDLEEYLRRRENPTNVVYADVLGQLRADALKYRSKASQVDDDDELDEVDGVATGDGTDKSGVGAGGGGGEEDDDEEEGSLYTPQQRVEFEMLASDMEPDTARPGSDLETHVLAPQTAGDGGGGGDAAAAESLPYTDERDYDAAVTCLNLCLEHPQCTAWTIADGVCALKKGIPVAAREESGAMGSVNPAESTEEPTGGAAGQTGQTRSSRKWSGVVYERYQCGMGGGGLPEANGGSAREVS
ncbi:hypothetical protein DFJ73DRAFT_893270 [Zopfochytrium polystomum]|nr:hypothetical protein DFJ73DRAFT_893270 [Zopfochytrium polystomum]